MKVLLKYLTEQKIQKNPNNLIKKPKSTDQKKSTPTTKPEHDKKKTSKKKSTTTLKPKHTNTTAKTQTKSQILKKQDDVRKTAAQKKKVRF